MYLYFVSDFNVKSIPVFFSLVLKVHFYKCSKKLILKIFINILLKHIDSNLALVFDTQDDLQSR